MEKIFESILETSLSGAVIIAVILALRLILTKTPKKFICLLWTLAILRLLVPFSIESSMSLQPNLQMIRDSLQPDHSTTQMEEPSVSAVPDTPPVSDPSNVGTQAPDVVIGDTDILKADIVSIDTAAIVATVWALIACGFLLYTAVSYALLKRKVQNSVQLDKNIFECSTINTPFLLGYLKPSIYLPTGLPPEDLELILAHEQMHLRRFDNWTKLLGFLALSLHWFNPLVWVAYSLLCRDIEMACDEDVVVSMDVTGRKAYSAALLRCAVCHRLGAVCPVAFGEVSVKQRIPKVLNYRKPAFWVSLAAVLAIVCVAVCFLTDPVPPTQKELDLAQCQEALETWQQMDSRHLREERVYEGGHILNDSAYSDYWKSGNRYLHISVIPLSGYRRQMNHILMDGKLLSREYTMANGDYGFYASGWEERDIPVSILYSWVDSFDWEAHAVEYIGQQEIDGTTVITVSITEDPAKCDQNHAYIENPYTVSFRFTADGTLDQLVMTSWYEYETGVDSETEQGIQQIISTFCLMPENADAVAAEVNHWYTNAEADMQAE